MSLSGTIKSTKRLKAKIRVLINHKKIKICMLLPFKAIQLFYQSVLSRQEAK